MPRIVYDTSKVKKGEMILTLIVDGRMIPMRFFMKTKWSKDKRTATIAWGWKPLRALRIEED